MMSRKSIDKDEADKIKQLMVREAVNLQVKAKVGVSDDTAPADRDEKKLRAMLKRKSLTPEEALLVKQMMMKEARNSSISNISTISECREKPLQPNPQQKSDTLNNTLNDFLSTSELATSGDSILIQTPSTTPVRKHRSSKVLFDYVSQNVDELDISVGETVEILEKQSDGWYRVRKISGGNNDVSEGLVPGNYLKEADTKISKSNQKVHVNSLLHKKSLSASEANEIRMMMTMLSDKQASAQDRSSNGDASQTDKFQNAFDEIEASRKDKPHANVESNDIDDALNKLKDDDLLRHNIEYWSVTKGSWLHVDVALDRKMAVLFVRIPDVENVLPIQISSVSSLDIDVDPETTMNSVQSLGSTSNKYCFRILESDEDYHIFATCKYMRLLGILSNISI